MKRLKSVLENKDAENREMKASWKKEVELLSRQGKINLDTMSRLEKSQSELQQQIDKVRKLEKTVDEYKQKIKHMNDQHKKELEDAKRPEKKRKISENEDSKQNKGQSTPRRWGSFWAGGQVGRHALKTIMGGA